MESDNKPVHTSEEFEIAVTKEDEPTIFKSAMQLWASGFKAKKIEKDRIQLSGYFRMIIDPKTGQTWSYVTPRDDQCLRLIQSK